MMTRDDVMTLLATLGDDVDVRIDTDGDLHVTVEDFDGFDSHWNEIERDYNEDAVDAVYETLKAVAVKVTADYYTIFDMGSFFISWGYASYDI